MLLALDIGNTNITLGAFQGDELRATWRLFTDHHRQPDEYAVLLHELLPLKGIQATDIRDVIICSVVPPLTTVFEEVARSHFKVSPIVVGMGTKTGVRILYDTPRDVGADRVVDAVAAYRLYGGPLVVVDFGTATVFDAITADGDYLGGAITPGVTISAEALNLGTSQLRRVELSPPASVIGKNTVAAIQSGLVFGHVALVEGMVKRFREELGEEAKAIATGGLAELIARETNIFHAVNEDLTLIGLRMVYDMNRQAG
jgi:type III pantothenate kinase